MGKSSLWGSFCDAIRDENIQDRKGDEARTVNLTLLNVLESTLDLSCLYLLLSKYSQTRGVFLVLVENQTVSSCEGRVHHFQRIMGFLKKGKAEILLTWRLGKPFSIVKMHVPRRAVRECPFMLNLTQCWCFCRGAGQEHCSWCLACLAIPGLQLLAAHLPTRSASFPGTHVGLWSIIFRGRLSPGWG